MQVISKRHEPTSNRSGWGYYTYSKIDVWLKRKRDESEKKKTTMI